MAVGVVGLGYVGLPLVVAFAEAGEHLVALDVDPLKVSAVSTGSSYIEDVPSERLQQSSARSIPPDAMPIWAEWRQSSSVCLPL